MTDFLSKMVTSKQITSMFNDCYFVSLLHRRPFLTNISHVNVIGNASLYVMYNVTYTYTPFLTLSFADFQNSIRKLMLLSKNI